MTKAKRLHLIGNAHIDPVWLWEWQEGLAEVIATFRSALDRMNEYDDFIFTASSAAFYEWVEQNDPRMFEEICRRIQEGRWIIAGGWWVEADCNIPSGESFVRHALYAQRYFQSRFGVRATVGFCPDSFGHHAMLPQLLKKSGMDAYVFMRPQPQEKSLPARLFWWEADDGSRVRAFQIPFEYCTWGQDVEPHVSRCAGEIGEGDATMVFYGVGNHGGGPTRENLDSLRRMQASGESDLVFSSPDAFFGAMATEGKTLPIVHDELQHHARGSYAAHSEIKRANRRTENLLLTAEKFAALAHWETGLAYPDLEPAWKDVLFNQFHDVMAGTCIVPAYENARALHGAATAQGELALYHALQSLAAHIQIPQDESKPFVVFNPHAWGVRAPVEVELGKVAETDGIVDDRGNAVLLQRIQPQATKDGRTRLAFSADLPPLGYRVYRVVPNAGAPVAIESPRPPILENDWFRLELDARTGCIRRLYDKERAVAIISEPAAVPTIVDDPSDTWSHDVATFDQVLGTMALCSIRRLEDGPVKSVLRVESEFRSSCLIQDFTLYRDLDRIDVFVTVDWREPQKMLKLRFPLNLDATRATAEIPYGHIVRRAYGEEEPCQNWIDVSGKIRENGTAYGLSLLNDGKYSYDVRGRDIGFTVLRSPAYAHHTPAMLQPERPYEYLDQGLQRFTYALLPHTGGWQHAATPRRAAELNAPPRVLATTFHPQGDLPPAQSFMVVDRANIVISAVKRAQDSDDLIVRAYETAGLATMALVRLPRWEREMQVAFRPCEIKTLAIPRDPAAPVRETNLLEEDE